MDQQPITDFGTVVNNLYYRGSKVDFENPSQPV